MRREREINNERKKEVVWRENQTMKTPYNDMVYHGKCMVCDLSYIIGSSIVILIISYTLPPS